MNPIQTVVINRIMMYTFSSFDNNNTGINVARMMMTPPIVGVPAFCTCPSKPKSLTVSPTCCLLK